MKSLAFLALLLAAGLAAPDKAKAEQPAGDAVLSVADSVPLSHSRDRAEILGRSVTLGDIFTNTGPRSGVVVMDAPAAGNDLVLDVHQLHALALRHNLYWKARSWEERVILSRASLVMDGERLRSILLRHLASHPAPMGGGRWEIESMERGVTMVLATDRVEALEVESLEIAEQTGRFMAIIADPSDSRTRTRLAGRMARMIDVPVASRRIQSGEILRAEDLDWISLRADRLARDILTEPEQMIGMTPQRAAIAAHAPLRQSDLRPPRLVTKGEQVTMTLTSTNMVLTARGLALDHGGLGEIVRIRNTQSQAIVEAEVTAPGTVRVASPLSFPLQSASRR